MTEKKPIPAASPEAPAADHASISRRRFLAGGAAVVGGLALGGDALAGVLIRDRRTAPEGTRAAAAPKRGGTLTVGSIGSTNDSLDPNKEASNMDLQRMFNLRDTLTYFGHDSFDLKYGLAESIELTAGATVATVRLRKGVTWHDGKPLNADDLIYSIKRIVDPSDPHAGLLKSVNPKALKKMDAQTVRIGLNYADAVFPERWYVPQLSILPSTFDPAKPYLGTGPFMYKSFTPGQRSVFVRNPNYWMSGKPYLDELVIIDMADPTAQINALLSGQVDAIDSVPLNETSAISKRSNLKLLEANGGYFQPIVMRTDVAPFTDNRVRQAFRLIADRPAMVTQAYNKYAAIGNDMPSHGDPSYPTMPQRHQDIEKAKSLLKAAGQDGLTVTMTTADEDYGLIPGAQVFAQNAKKAGVNVKLNVIQPSVFDPKFLKWTFTQGYWGNKPFGIMWSLLYAPGGIFNETNFNDAEGNKIYSEALKDTNPASRNEKFKELEKILYDRGGHIIHTFRKTVDAHSTKFTGFTPDKSTGWSLGQYRYKEVSLA